jgi:uncharacterized membrane protein
MTSTTVHEPRVRAPVEAQPADGWSSERIVARVVLGVAAAYALVVGTLAVLRYESFASDFDHGIFTQYVWLFGHLHEPFNTIVLRNLLGDHVEPGIALLAPLGALGLAAPGILVVQTLALAATAPLLYLLARAHGATGWVAAAPGLLWCASPVVLHPALLDFHPEALVPALLAGGCLALARERIGWFAATVVLACAMKEDVGLVYAALGLVLAWEGRRRLGGVLAGAAAAYSLFAVYVVLPIFGNASGQEFNPRFAGARGDSFFDVVHYSLVHPLTTVESTLGLAELGILLLLIATTGGLCLLAPRWLLLAVPPTALNLFSAYELQHTIDYHYWIVAVGSVAVAGAVGAGRVGAAGRRTWLGWSAAAGAVLVLLALQWTGEIVRQIRVEWPRRADREAIADAVPGSASVAAPMQMLAHLADRKRVYVLPEPMVAVRVGTRWGAAERAEATRGLEYAVNDAHMRPWGSMTASDADRLLVRHGFREVMRRGDTVLYAKEPAR